MMTLVTATNVPNLVQIWPRGLLGKHGKYNHTHTRLTVLFRDYTGELVPER